jgi:hypothetical protein
MVAEFKAQTDMKPDNRTVDLKVDDVSSTIEGSYLEGVEDFFGVSRREVLTYVPRCCGCR